MPVPSADDAFAPLLPLDLNFAFSVNYADCQTAADVVVGAKDELQVLFRLMHEGGTRLTSDMLPMPLDFVLGAEDNDFGPDELRAEEGGKADRQADPDFEKIVTGSLPWLEHLDFKQGLTGRASTETAETAEGPSVADEDEIWEGLQRLERARIAEAARFAAEPDRDFVAKVRGGESEVYKSGEVVHAMQGQCTGRVATAWARGHASASFKATFQSMGHQRLRSSLELGVTGCIFLIWRCALLHLL